MLFVLFYYFNFNLAPQKPIFMQISFKKVLFLSLIFFACEGENKLRNQTNSMLDSTILEQEQIPFGYELEKPTAKYTLDKDLEEISGLSCFGEGQLACVQDEEGYVFIFDEQKQGVIEKYKFAKKGDYEDIEVVGNTIYVSRNDGVIYEIRIRENQEVEVLENKTFLNEKDNIEGLVFDKKTNSLLLACKGNTDKKTAKNKREVYTFDLETKKLKEDPFFLINFEDIANFTGEDEVHFNTSGIAIHPISGEIYMIASSGKKLIVVNRDGFILDVQPLPRKIFSQPEGICFDLEGTLYISNEARGGKATILKFKTKQ